MPITVTKYVKTTIRIEFTPAKLRALANMAEEHQKKLTIGVDRTFDKLHSDDMYTEILLQVPNP